jgi:site-specific DNA recombinase
LGKTGSEGKQEERHEMTPRTAVLYARVSSREQREEGFSIEAQVKFLRAAASKDEFDIVREFIEVESAKSAGRKQFAEMVTFFKKNRSCRILLVEKTDRLYRNQRDALTLEDLDISIHFVKENETLSKDAKSQTKLMQDIRLAMARNYSENLREEVKKGMGEKASQGTYPGRPPFGYRNNVGTRTIEFNPEKAPIAKRVFELYVSGRHSLLTLSKTLRMEGTCISKTNLHKMLTNPFYIGRFNWGGQTYQGTQPHLISSELFSRVQFVLNGGNTPKYSKHEIAFRGLLKCAHDDCTVTGEIKKGKYVYYRCSHGRGPCDLPYFREEKIAEKMGDLLRDLYIPGDVAKTIQGALERGHGEARARQRSERSRLEHTLQTLYRHVDAAYTDKLDGKIPEEFWQRKQAEWQQEEATIKGQISNLGEAKGADPLLDVRRILELAQSAHSLYVTRETGRTSGIAEKSTFELLYRCRKSLSYLYIPLRHHL